MINYIISECSKLTQKKYKTRHDWVGKVIHSELCKRLKFAQADDWYMLEPESVLENVMYTILSDFEIQMVHPVSARRPDLFLINKKMSTCHSVDFAIKMKEIEKIDRYLDLARELKKL